MKVFNRNIGDTETYVETLRFLNPDRTEQNLAGHTVRFVVSKDGEDLDSWDAEIAGAVASFAVDHLLDAGRYRYRIEHEQPDLTLYWVIKGDLVVNAE